MTWDVTAYSSHGHFLVYFGSTMLNSEIPFSYASNTTFNSFSSENRSIRRFNEAKADKIVLRRFAPFAVLLTRYDYRMLVSVNFSFQVFSKSGASLSYLL